MKGVNLLKYVSVTKQQQQKKVVLNIKTIYLTLEICGKENRRKYGLTQRIWYML